MRLRPVFHQRSTRLAVLVAAVACWTLALVGAFIGSAVALGLGLTGAGVLAVGALKVVFELESEGRRPAVGVVPIGRTAPRPPAPQPLTSTPAPAAPGAPTEGQLELYSDRTIADDTELVARVRAALIEHHFSKLSGWTEADGPDKFRVDLDRHSYMRHDAAVAYVVPWVNQAVPLDGTSIVEIGCGTGSSTVAFAPFSDKVYGYDISPSSIAAAHVRLEAHGLTDRAELIVSPPSDLLSTVEGRHQDEPVDIVLLYALLEHQTLDERMETLRLAQRILRPGGAIVVTETPNRLTYFDRHTSQLPFFHMLPIELQLLYADRSPRQTFADNIAYHRSRGLTEPALRELMIRWGQSVSFHDFEVAIGDVSSRVLSSGLHPNLMKLRPERPEEAPLRQFLQEMAIDVHPGFTRYYLDLIIGV